MILAALLFGSGAAHAQPSFPNRPLRLVVPFVPGGGSDFVARVVSQKMTESPGQQIVVDHRAGGAGVIAAELVAHAPPDGHTLFLASTSFAVTPSLQKKLPFDPLRDFAPVTRISITPGVLVVQPSTQIRSVKELIALAKARPGELSFGSAGVAAASHLAGELFKLLAGVQMLHVPYKGSSQVTTALLGGEISLAFISPASILAHINSGRLRALAVTTAQRTPLLPEVPTIAEAGVPDYENSIWTGVLVPSATPKPIVMRLHTEIGNALRSADVVESLARGRRATGVRVAGSVCRLSQSDHRQIGAAREGRGNHRELSRSRPRSTSRLERAAYSPATAAPHSALWVRAESSAATAWP